jgi:GT2 family glycosyltransferase
MAGCSVIIISYNSGTFLPACLHSLYNTISDIDLQIIVWDNGSVQPLPQALIDRFPQVDWIFSKENLGFGVACNRSAERAKYDYLFFVNPDTVVSHGTFVKILDYYKSKNDAGVVGCKILNGDRTLQWACRRSFPSPTAAIYKTLGLATLFPKSKRFGAYNLTYLNPDDEAEVDAVSGSFFCIKKEVFWEVKGFDEDFFLYGEDLDIFYRVQKKGYKNYYYPGTSVVHFKGQSSRTRLIRSFVNFYNAMLIFARKHKEFRPAPLFLMSFGVGLAAVLGVFPRLIPQWWKLLFDLFMALALWFSFNLLGFEVSSNWVLLSSVLMCASYALAGEYGDPGSGSKPGFRNSMLLVVLAGVTYSFFKDSMVSVAFNTLLVFNSIVWRKLTGWAAYFKRALGGGHRRAAIFGCFSGVSRFFTHENFLSEFELLGCVASKNAAIAARDKVHLLGSLDDLSEIQRRTGLKELLLVSDENGLFGELPDQNLMNSLNLGSKLLIGAPDTGTFVYVDLHFNK